jgi:hypothetical protein
MLHSLWANGYDENSATYALGWSLQQSHHLLEEFIKYCLGKNITFDRDKITIELQKHGHDGGYTDLEIRPRGCFHLIIEAKKGWELPTKTQLYKYTSRFEASEKIQKLITMSVASSEYAERRFPPDIKGFLIQHLSWKDVFELAVIAKNITSTNTEKLWLNQFKSHIKRYIKRYISMTHPTNNLCILCSYFHK